MKFIGVFLILMMVSFSFVGAVSFGYNNLDNNNPAFGYGGVQPSNITNNYNNYSVNGTALELDDITDVDVSSPIDGQVLTWDSGVLKWIATTISNWLFDTSNGYLYNDSTTVYFNETKLNQTIDIRAPSTSSDNYKIYFNHSNKDVIVYNLSDSDASIITVYTVSGQKEIFGSEFA